MNQDYKSVVRYLSKQKSFSNTHLMHNIKEFNMHCIPLFMLSVVLILE